jgi:hypothetical protein
MRRGFYQSCPRAEESLNLEQLTKMFYVLLRDFLHYGDYPAKVEIESA